MRALGPGSLSSLLKIVVEVVHVALWALLAAQIAGGAALLVFQPFISTVFQLDLHSLDHSRSTQVAGRAPEVAALLFAFAAYVGVLIVILNRVRRVFGTLTQGDPFQPENVNRLRAVGIALIALEATGYLLRMVFRWAVPEAGRHADLPLNPTAWFAILVVFVLAEVFREGARLRQEAELTI